eukprot:evm.model.scf_287.11 EVM.evm.TU.scf_287.11   scf_287:78477-79595(+)
MPRMETVGIAEFQFGGNCKLFIVRKIEVQNVCHTGGQWSAEGDFTNVRMTPLEHDTTGGIAAKVQEAANIAMLGIDVIIAQAGSTDGEDACRDGLDVGSSWMGTQVLAARGNEHRCLCGTDE